MACKCYCELPVQQEITGVPETGYNPFFFGTGGDALIFRFTDASFTRVLSALWNGAIIAYGDQAYQVIWDFLVNVEYPVSICDYVAECFSSDAEFRASVINSLKNDPEFKQAVQEISRVGQPLIGGQITGPLTEECDRDAAWSGLLALINQMSNVNVDFLQYMESQTNELEKVSGLLANIPVFGTIASSLTTSFVNSVVEDAAENYEGIVTDALLEEYTCDLFCMMSDDPSCALSFEQMYNYFRDRIAGTFEINSAFATVVDFISTGTYTGTAIVDFMFMTQIAILREANDFMGFDYVNMQVTIDVGRASPSNAWETLCPDCPPPPVEGCTDFTSEQGLWEISGGNGVWDVGQGYEGLYYSGFGSTALWIMRPSQVGQPDITDISFTIDPSHDVTNAFLYINDVYAGGLSGLTGATLITFNSASVGGTWPKGGDAKIELRLETPGDKGFRLVEACITSESP